MLLLAFAALSANPATLSDAIERARPGDTIRLARGDYGMVTLPRRAAPGVVTLDAADARFSGIIARDVQGIEVRGGTLAGPREQQGGFVIDSSRRIAVRDMTISGARVGIAVSRSTDIDIIGNRLDAVRSDGINIAMVQRARIVGNRCVNFAPIAAVYDRQGKLMRDGDHPDCIQGWSRPNAPPTADIVIESNYAEGFMQGIWFGDAGNGGYDRIIVRNNDLRLSAWHGISVYEGRGTVITGNSVRTLPGARAQNYPFQPIRSWIYATGTNLKVCDNKVSAIPNGQGTKRCR